LRSPIEISGRPVVAELQAGQHSERIVAILVSSDGRSVPIVVTTVIPVVIPVKISVGGVVVVAVVVPAVVIRVVSVADLVIVIRVPAGRDGGPAIPVKVVGIDGWSAEVAVVVTGATGP
jgi:hypothetical protein